MIRVQRVSKRFGRVHAVRDVSFTLEPGQIAGLLGPNGAGKSTTIRMVTGFLCPDRGSVAIAGHDTVRAPGPARRLLGYLPESAPSYPEMRAIDYLTYRGRLQGLKRRDARRAAAEAADRCRIGNMSRRRISTLSKGYRQRVGLAAALVHEPRVLVLDEPTNGLDPSQIRDARSLIRELAENRTMLISSHILPEIERMCDRVIMIVSGRVRADGSPAELASQLSTRFRLEYRPVNGVDPLAPRVRQLQGIAEIKQAELPDGWRTLEALGANDRVRTDLSELIRDESVQVRELAVVKPSLEDVFVKYTEASSAEELEQ